MTGTNKKLREALLSDMDIAVLRMPVHLAFAGNMAQFQYHNRVQALLDRIEALATPTAEQVDDINVAESFTSVTKTAAPAQGEPFGYFRAEPFGWTDCPEDAEGAIALYEHPAHEKHWTENEPVRLPSARTDRVYLAGPMTGIAELNFPAFNQEAERLRAEGLQVLNPADHGIVDGADWADYLRHDIAGLSSCERIHLLRGWTKSKGACLEMTIAKALGMTVTYQVDAEIEHNNAPAQDQCNACCGTGRMVRDPDIGTDQECFVCDGTGFLPAQEPVTLTPAEIDHAVLEATGFDGFGTQPMNTHDTRNIGLEVIAALRAKGGK